MSFSIPVYLYVYFRTQKQYDGASEHFGRAYEIACNLEVGGQTAEGSGVCGQRSCPQHDADLSQAHRDTRTPEHQENHQLEEE